MENSREFKILEMGLEYKKQYNECAWWKFDKRTELRKSWQSALDLLIRHYKQK